jgi:metal-sulfur cluster biosynthetic enzyme
MITEPAVRDALGRVIDPELGINIVDLGLVYGVDIDDDSRVRVVMTMTSPACPLGDYLTDLVDSTVKWRLPEVKDVQVCLVWEPPWSPDMMSAGARRQLDGGAK